MARQRALQDLDVPLQPDGKLYAKSLKRLRRLTGHDGSGRTVGYWEPYAHAAGYRIVLRDHDNKKTTPARFRARTRKLETVEVPVTANGKLHVSTAARLRRLSGSTSQARTFSSWSKIMLEAGYVLAEAPPSPKPPRRAAAAPKSRVRNTGRVQPPPTRKASRKTATARPRTRANPASSPRPPHRFEPGDEIDGRFVVVGLLGEGAFGDVYEVTDLIEDRNFALKIVRSTSPRAALREVSAHRHISHAKIVPVYWCGQLEDTRLWIVMELAEGDVLTPFAMGQSTLTDDQALSIGVDILEALIAVHPDVQRIKELETIGRSGDMSQEDYAELQALKADGFVHRDIKPSNIILSSRGARILDFGISSRVGDPISTRSSTPRYAAPDLAQERWDVSTDLFAVGVTLYELLCSGEHPYPDGLPVYGESVIDPRHFRPDLPVEIAEFLIRACASDSADRFATARDMHEALASLREAARPLGRCSEQIPAAWSEESS